jgi:signal transduction histidine kinase
MKNRHRERKSAPEQDLSATILNWASTSDSSAPMPAQDWLLGFQNPQIERAYLDAEHRRNRTYYAVTLSIVTLLVASFIWTDPWLLPLDALSIFRVARIYALVPISLLATISATWLTSSTAWTLISAVLLIMFGLVHAFLLLVTGISVFEYLELGMLQVILGTFLAVGLPVRWSLAIVTVFWLTFGPSVLRVENSLAPFMNFTVDFLVFSCIGGFAAYRYENASRRAFIAHLLSRKEYSERLVADSDRKRWLEVIAAFLRHELKNSMTAISTSIEMADRAAPQSEAGKYLDRGRRSVHYMDQLLTKVADATNLESALAQHEFEPIDFSQLVMDRIEDFINDNPDRTFATEVEPDIHILGHADSLVQMLDKLINNALEHGDHARPIGIYVRNQSMYCSITVSDVGDSLPADTLQIFEPFVSNKAGRAGASNLGLGLFVARAIAISHGGNIRAEPLLDAAGARFTVQLPRLGETASRGNPSISTPPLGTNPVEARFDP